MEGIDIKIYLTTYWKLMSTLKEFTYIQYDPSISCDDVPGLHRFFITVLAMSPLRYVLVQAFH